MWPQHITDGGDARLGFDRATRMRMIGNAFSNAHMREILCKWSTPIHEATVASITSIAAMTTDELEIKLNALNHSKLKDWVAPR